MNQLAGKIAAEIGSQGPISFARFMEMALYCPVYGYYEKEEDRIGRQGDFFTNISVGKLFGQLLACQFAEWFTSSAGRPHCQSRDSDCHTRGQSLAPSDHSAEPLQPLDSLSVSNPWQPAGDCYLVEAGAHKGELALDILSWFKKHRPDLFDRVLYWIVEPSIRRQSWQRRALACFGGKVVWVVSVDFLKSELERAEREPTTSTVFFSNELLDAMPVVRLGWDTSRRDWFEWGVTLENGAFKWTRLHLKERGVQQQVQDFFPFIRALTPFLPDGYTIEISPTAVQWWQDAAGAVRRGRLLTIDYGGTAEELLVPERTGGTLRAYRAHHLSRDPLLFPGEQDLTTHVNFNAIEAAAVKAGLRTERFVTQAQFLTAAAARVWNKEVPFDPWRSHHTRQFKTLTHPEHLGRAFRVLVQARD